MCAEVIEVRGQVIHSVDLHPAGDTTENRGSLVVREVTPGAPTEKDQDISQRSFPLVGGRLLRRSELWSLFGGKLRAGVAGEIGEQPLRHLPRFQDPIHHSGVDRRLGRPGIFALVRVLGDREPTLLLNPFDTECPVAVGSRKDQRGGMWSMGVRKRAEEKIHRDPLPPRPVDLAQLQMAVDRDEILAGRNDVDMIRFDFLAVPRLQHGHPGVLRKNARESRFMGGHQMDDDDEDHPCIVRHRAEKLVQSLDAPCRSTETHHRCELIPFAGDDIIDLRREFFFDDIGTGRGKIGGRLCGNAFFRHHPPAHDDSESRPRERERGTVRQCSPPVLRLPCSNAPILLRSKSSMVNRHAP